MSANNDLLDHAIQVYQNVPSAGTAYTMVHAIVQVRIKQDLAVTRTYKDKFNLLLKNKEWPPEFGNSDDAKVKRTMTILQLSQGKPNISSIMRLAGCLQQECNPGALCMRLQRRIKKAEKEA